MKQWIHRHWRHLSFWGGLLALLLYLGLPVSGFLEPFFPEFLEAVNENYEYSDDCTLGHIWAERKGTIVSVDATQENLYIAYHNSIVDAFDREGNYCFTWYFRNNFRDGKLRGDFSVVCCDGLLYVDTQKGSCFVFDGERELGTVERLPQTGEWVSVTNETVEKYDADGNLLAVFQVPEGLRLVREDMPVSEMVKQVAVMYAILLIGLLAFRVWIKHRVSQRKAG